MYKEELKEYSKNIWKSGKNIDSELTNIKVMLHNIEKLGKDTKDMEKQLDNVGIELYKLKRQIEELEKELLK